MDKTKSTLYFFSFLITQMYTQMYAPYGRKDLSLLLLHFHDLKVIHQLHSIPTLKKQNQSEPIALEHSPTYPNDLSSKKKNH